MGDHDFNTPTSVWFCHPRNCHCFSEVSSCLQLWVSLLSSPLFFLEALFHILLDIIFDVHPDGQSSNFLLFEESDGLRIQIQLINCITEVSSQTWKIWSPVSPQFKSKLRFFRRNGNQEEEKGKPVSFGKWRGSSYWQFPHTEKSKRNIHVTEVGRFCWRNEKFLWEISRLWYRSLYLLTFLTWPTVRPCWESSALPPVFSQLCLLLSVSQDKGVSILRYVRVWFVHWD